MIQARNTRRETKLFKRAIRQERRLLGGGELE